MLGGGDWSRRHRCALTCVCDRNASMDCGETSTQLHFLVQQPAREAEGNLSPANQCSSLQIITSAFTYLQSSPRINDTWDTWLLELYTFYYSTNSDILTSFCFYLLAFWTIDQLEMSSWLESYLHIFFTIQMINALFISFYLYLSIYLYYLLSIILYNIYSSRYKAFHVTLALIHWLPHWWITFVCLMIFYFVAG